MKSVANMSVGELAAYISSHLRDLGIDVVLSGGSCVAIYSAGEYVSKDLDFIQRYSSRRSRIGRAMSSIGFMPLGDCYRHPDTDFLVDFPSGPLAVGKEPVGSVNEIQFPTGRLRILSPTDCVKDRLAAYYHWNDQQCLDQAVAVARSVRVDLKEVARWSRQEGKSEAFKKIAARLES